ncbi:transposase [Mycobacterium paraense]|uniref:transposase n=1 Tax=Mycobacterium paraense TaxID=767916 RepID=UPI000A156F51
MRLSRDLHHLPGVPLTPTIDDSGLGASSILAFTGGTKGNSAKGRGGKTVLTTTGAVELEVRPRDRNGAFSPVIIPRRKRRLGWAEDMIFPLNAHDASDPRHL